MIWKYHIEKETISETIRGNYVYSSKEIIPIPQACIAWESRQDFNNPCSFTWIYADVKWVLKDFVDRFVLALSWLF